MAAMKKLDIKRRHTSLTTLSYSTSTPVQKVSIPKDGHGKIIRGRLAGSIALATGGGTSGTLLTLIPNPLAVIKKIYIEYSPSPRGGPKLDLPIEILHLMWFRAFKKKPRLTGLPDGGVATTAIEAEFCIPLSLVQSYFERASLYPDSRHSNGGTFTLTVEWYNTDAGTRDALLSGSNRTLTATNLRVELMLDDFYGSDVGDPAFEVVFRYFKKDLTSSGASAFDLKVPSGESIRCVGGIVVNNSARDDNALGNVMLNVGPVSHVNMKFLELEAKNQSDYQVSTTDWLTGGFFADLDVDGDLKDVANIQKEGTDPVMIPDTTGATTALSGTSYIYGFIESVIVTEAGKAVAA